MECSPCRSSLYRKLLRAVILASVVALVAVWLATTLYAQEGGLVQHYGRKPADTGPRALGLVQLSTTGKARLIPLVIMMDGKFYDASSYKAMPVPMALDFGIIYEAFHTGVSQGLFTITQPGQLNHNWIAEGSWLPAGAKAPEKTKKYAAPVIDEDNKDDRPVLHRHAGSDADKKGTDKKDESKPADSSTTTSSTTTPSTNAPSSTSTSSPASTTTSTASKDASSNASKDSAKDAAKPSAATTARASDLDEPIKDPNRPILRRGKPDPNAHHEAFVNFDDPSDSGKSAPTKGASKAAGDTDAASVQTFTAISDAGGPDPRPYTYDLKPAEETIYRNKMLDLAAKLVKLAPRQAIAQQNSSKAPTNGAHKKSAVSNPKDQFEDVHLRIFDLSNSNEPVLVLSARTPVPPSTSSGAQVPQEITLVARTDLEGELQKLFFAQTDSRHLDVSPRMELIDAVDADGDGRGELLFRRTFDDGSAYALYRVTADRLWPLYEGNP